MIYASAFPSYKRLSLILVCAMLGACATTQRSSSGGGQEAAAPISEPIKAQTAAKPQTTAKPGETANPSAPGAAGTAAKPDSNTAKSADAPAVAAAKQPMPESAAAIDNDDEAARLKRQLAEQDAQINKLRSDQQADAAGVDANAKQQEVEAAMPQDQPTAAVAKQPEQDSATPQDQPAAVAATQRPASPVAATKADDAIAVFPSNSNVAENRVSRPEAERPLERSVYFDFDQSRVAEKYDSMLMTNAAYIKAHPDLQTEVQGNCDERGSREYNLALGARRAEAVKRALELAGANGSSISAISFGAEKPVTTGKDEESYSKNRRVDIVY